MGCLSRDTSILGDPGADSGDEEKSKRAEKYMARRKVKTARRAPGLFSPFFTFHDVRLRFSLSEFRYLSTWNSTPEKIHIELAQLNEIEKAR